MDIYPVHQNLINSAEAEASAVFCVDIGGGKGHDLDKLHNRFPILPGRLILQDLQKVTTSSVVFESMVHDFFQPQPIKGMGTRAFCGWLCRSDRAKRADSQSLQEHESTT